MKDYSSAAEPTAAPSAAPTAAPADFAASNVAAAVDEDNSDDPATGSAAYAYWAANVGSADNQSFGLGHSFEERVVDYCYCYCLGKSGDRAPEGELLRNRRPGDRARRKRTAAMASAGASVGGESGAELE